MGWGGRGWCLVLRTWHNLNLPAVLVISLSCDKAPWLKQCLEGKGVFGLMVPETESLEWSWGRRGRQHGSRQLDEKTEIVSLTTNMKLREQTGSRAKVQTLKAQPQWSPLQTAPLIGDQEFKYLCLWEHSYSNRHNWGESLWEELCGSGWSVAMSVGTYRDYIDWDGKTCPWWVAPFPRFGSRTV